MAIRYEIYLRTDENMEPLTEQRAVPALRAAGFEPVEGKLGQLDLGHGKLAAAVYSGSDWDATPAEPPTTSDDRAIPIEGINLSFPLGLPDAEGDTAVGRMLAVASALGVAAYDPQLGSLVSGADHERIVNAWRQSHDFQFDIAGNTDLGTGAPTPAYHSRTTIPSRYKLMAIIALAILLLIMMVRSCVERWIEHDMYEAPETTETPDAPNTSGRK
ncbi:MAG TPA: hypothetical protein VM425_00055 [Myxococcota bacterium]|nr:hypothetical protein [Myxococcota bacterium]